MAHGLIDFGMRAMNCLRLEKGYRRLGSDLTPDTTPFEAGMEGFVALDGPDFIGRDALLRAREKGPRRRLAMLEVDAADADAVGNEPVFEDGQIVGYVSSGGYGHTVGKSLALAYLRPDLASDGHELAVEILGERRRSVVIPDTVYDPNGGRLRS
jgi:dimethylglycine dehydrogenase